MHPDRQECFELKLVGNQPKIKPIAIKNNEEFLKKTAKMERETEKQSHWKNTDPKERSPKAKKSAHKKTSAHK